MLSQILSGKGASNAMGCNSKGIMKILFKRLRSMLKLYVRTSNLNHKYVTKLHYCKLFIPFSFYQAIEHTVLQIILTMSVKLEFSKIYKYEIYDII